MNHTLSAALILSLTVVAPTFAAGKAPRKTPSTLPPTSKMIVVPPVDPAPPGTPPQKLLSSEMSGQDLQFFTTVVEAGRFQAYLVDMLKTKAQSEQIKALAGALSDTQGQENKQVVRLAAAKGWPVSAEPTATQTAVGVELEKLSGAEFDKAVMDKVVAASEQSFHAYEGAAQSTDKEIKSFAEQMLPLAREKVQLVEKMTGAGKGASQLFRTGAPSKPVPAGTPKVESGTTPSAIIPSKPKPVATPAVKQATVPSSASTPARLATPAASGPKPIPPPTTN